MKYDQLIPMLNVRNIETSLNFYEEKFEFKRVSSDMQLKEWRWARGRLWRNNLHANGDRCIVEYA